jgi:molecular chaperone HtpG
MTEGTTPRQKGESFEFKAEIQQLLNILVHSLYTEREIFLRELLSNASDALNRIQFEMLTNRDVLDPDAELAIRISVDEEARTITISDSGIGMTREEIIEDLGIIAHSGAARFLRQLEQAAPDGARRPAVEMIGQFGVGFYSVFMVAEQVRVISRSYKRDAETVEWVSDGSTNYQIYTAEKAERGTTIEVKLKEDATEFANTWRLERIIRKHSDFVPFPVYLDGRDEAVNRRMALWRQAPGDVTQEQYDDFYTHLTQDLEAPLLHVHLVTDAPVDIRSILFVPSRLERGMLSLRPDYGLSLYINNVLIKENNKDLLPSYLRFAEGIVESADLPLNISREAVQSSPAARRIQNALSRRLIRALENLKEEPAEYGTFWRNFGPFIKEGIAADPAAKDDLVPLLVFHTSQGGEDLVSLDQYAERMSDDQKAIYYVLGDDLKTVARSPHLDYFLAHDIEVLYLVDPVDSLLVMNLQEFKGTPLKNVDDAGLELPQKDRDGAAATGEEDSPVDEVAFNRLVGRFVKVLGDRVIEIRESKVLTTNPCRLVAPNDDPMREMSRLYRMLDREFDVPKRILEINRSHPIIVNLASLVSESPEADAIDASIEQLFENQLLVEGEHPNPAEMIPRIQQLIEAATRRASGGPATETD